MLNQPTEVAMTTLDPYTTLGVRRDATLEAITSAWRLLAQTTHPDKGGSTERMAAINAAYALLSDPKRRARYDAQHAKPLPAVDFHAPELAGIKALVAAKPVQEIHRIRDEIRAHIRSFEQRDVNGFGGPLNDPRLLRHRLELQFLNHLLS
jgi:curved DNA-binding protein CbpA